MSWNPVDNDESGSEDEFEISEKWRGREAFIFLIDSYLYENEKGFEDCLDSIKNSILNGILTRDKDLIGIVFYNTLNSPAPKDQDGMKNIVVHKNTSVLIPLTQLSKNIVEYYLEFNTPDYFDFKNRYGYSDGNFTDAIWLCTNMFMQCGFKLSSSTIILFTDKNTPHPPATRMYQLAMEKADDLKQTDIDFNVIPMKDDFDYDIFYKEFICTIRDIELDSFIKPNPIEERKLIADRLVRQNFQKRCNNHIRWNLSDDLEISAGIYNFYRRNVYPHSVKLLRKDNSIVEVKHVHKIGRLDNETNEILDERYCMPSDQRKVITIGGKKIPFTSDELTKMRSPLPPRLSLLGFKPLTTISIHSFVKSSSFLYPDDEIISGSTKLFRAIWEKCIEKEKIALCSLIARRKSSPRYVALVPIQSSGIDSNHMENDGFRIVYLPCEIDYRNIEFNDRTTSDLTDKQIELFHKVTKKLKIKYNPTMFKDPSLELLHANIAGLAFDMKIEGAENNGLPDIEMQDERIEPVIDNLIELFGKDLDIAVKRRGGPTDQDRQSKAPKITDELLSREQIDQLIATNTLEQLTVKQLKNYLQHNNVKGLSTLSKPSLIEKVMELHS